MGKRTALNGIGYGTLAAAKHFTCVATLALCCGSEAAPLTEWHVRNSTVEAGFEGVTYGAGLFVAVGEEGTIVSSPDGITWTKETSPATLTLEDVVYANGVFVAVGRGSTLMISPNGHAWTKHIYDQGSGPVNLIHDGSRFVLLKAGAGLSISTNGLNWTQAGAVGAQYDAGGIAFGNGAYVEVGYKRTGQPPDVYSAPSLNGPWTKRDGKSTANMFGVGFAKGLFIAGGQDGTLITSPDGAEWTARDSQTSGFIWSVTAGGPYAVAASQWGRMLVSENGTDWLRMETEVAGHLKDVVFGAGTFVAVGWDGAIVQSNVIEPVQSEGGEIRITKPAWVNGAFSCEFQGIIGANYVLEGSTDCGTWTERQSATCNAAPMVLTDVGAAGHHSVYRVVKR